MGARVPVADAQAESLAEARAYLEDPENAPSARSLTAAIAQEGLVEDADLERCMWHVPLHARMNPGERVFVCGACGVYDVPIVPLPAAGDRKRGLLSAVLAVH